MIGRFAGNPCRYQFAASLTALLLGLPLARTSAQQPPATGAAPNAPEVGHMAPEFSVPAATRYGLLATPARLSDFRGQTVVLAFFFQARTKG